MFLCKLQNAIVILCLGVNFLVYILPLGPCKCPPNANCRGASAANNGQHLPLLPAFLREIFFFFPKKGSSHSDRSDCSGSSAHRCFKAPTMPQTMHATLFVFPSTLHNTEPISAAVKGKKKKKKVLEIKIHTQFGKGAIHSYLYITNKNYILTPPLHHKAMSSAQL